MFDIFLVFEADNIRHQCPLLWILGGNVVLWQFLAGREVENIPQQLMCFHRRDFTVELRLIHGTLYSTFVLDIT